MPHNLFTYELINADELSDPYKIDLDVPPTKEKDKALLEKLASYCPLNQAKEILDQVIKQNILMGVAKRESEVAKRWGTGPYPMMPEIITIKKSGVMLMNVVSDNVSPITQSTLYEELKQVVELCKLSGEIKIKKITVKPAWQMPVTTQPDNDRNISFDAGKAYPYKDVDLTLLKILLSAVVGRFNTILPELKLDYQNPVEVKEENCKPAEDVEGLCGAWYVMDLQDLMVNGKQYKDRLKVRIPVGLTKPGSDSNPILKVGLDETVKTNIYTLGLDYRFLCEADVFQRTQRSFVMQLWSHLTFLNAKLRAKDLSAIDINKLLEPVEKFNTHPSRGKWQDAEDALDKNEEAKKIVPNILGNSPLAVFTKDGIYLLEPKQQVAPWCVKNGLLDKLFYVPPWDSTAPWLDQRLDQLFRNEGSEWSTPSKNFPGGREALEEDVRVTGKKCFTNASDSSRQLLTVSASSIIGLPQAKQEAWRNKLGNAGITIREFRDKETKDRMKFIDEAWEMLTTGHGFDQAAIKMDDPGYDDDQPRLPLPTSWCPVSPGSTLYHKRCKDVSHPWKELAIGFRIEGTWNELKSTLDRYEKPKDKNDKKDKGQGMTQWRCDPDFMYKTKRMVLTGTKLANPREFVFWNKNNDTFNETAVCVSRNLFGATAFPERDYEGEYTLFALDCFDLNGFDTEHEQVELGRPWRPGEKAFEQILNKNIIGWVRINKLGGVKGIYWKFEIFTSGHGKFNSKWDNWNPNPAWESEHDLDYRNLRWNYITAELEAWRGVNRIDGTKYDFVKD